MQVGIYDGWITAMKPSPGHSNVVAVRGLTKLEDGVAQVIVVNLSLKNLTIVPGTIVSSFTSIFDGVNAEVRTISFEASKEDSPGVFEQLSRRARRNACEEMDPKGPLQPDLDA